MYNTLLYKIEVNHSLAITHNIYYVYYNFNFCRLILRILIIIRFSLLVL